MNKIEFIPRIVENKDWITIVFIVAVALVAITKAAFENRFVDFVNLIANNKYIKMYKDPSNLMSWFTILLFFVQLISFSFFVQLVLSYFGYTTKTNWITFIQIFTFLTFFVLSRAHLLSSTPFPYPTLFRSVTAWPASRRPSVTRAR